VKTLVRELSLLFAYFYFNRKYVGSHMFVILELHTSMFNEILYNVNLLSML
jgi:hypothetical protein